MIHEQEWEQGIRRRDLLVRGVSIGGVVVGGGAVASWLAACGGDNGSSDTGSGSSLTAEEIAAAQGTINLLGWSFYEAKAQNAGPVQAKLTPATNPEAMLAKIRPENSPFDVTEPTSSNLPEWFALDVLEPIDVSLIPNFTNVAENLRNDPSLRGPDNEIYAIPLAVSVGLTAWDSDAVPEPKTLEDLTGPAYKPGIGLFDSPNTIVSVAQTQQAAGSSGLVQDNHLTKAGLEEAQQFLDSMRANVRTVFTFGDEAQLLPRGDIAVAYPTYGSVITKAQQAQPSIQLNLTGQTSFIDTLAIRRGADLPASYSWINQALTVPAGRGLSIASASYSAVDGATAKKVQPDILRDVPVGEAVKMAPITASTVPESEGDLATIDEVNSAWADFKASFG